MKKLLALALASLLTLSVFAGCGKEKGEAGTSEPKETYQSVDINVAGLKGPTGIGMVRLMEQSDAGEAANKYTFSLASAPTEIVGKISSGEVDIAAVPTNLAATLYQKTNGGVKLLAVNTLGVLYLLEKGDSIHSVADLKGKTIYASGQGSTTEYVLNYLLEQAGMTVGEDVKVEYKADHSELAALIASGEADIALLPEPFVTTVTSKNADVRVALDITEQWKKTTGDKELPMGGIIVRTEFLEKNPAAVEKFLEEYKASTEYTATNLAETAALTEKYDIMKADVAQKAIPNCNIVYLDGAAMKESVKSFFEILLKADAKSIGGKLPDDALYYEKAGN